jgi:hypothetical protein
VALAVFWPTNPDRAEPLLRDAEAAARALGLQLRVLKASDDGRFWRLCQNSKPADW